MSADPVGALQSGPETLVRDVQQGLAEGRFVPGQRLVEPDLMRHYGVGRSTVREALGRLSAIGLAEVAPHRGARIRRLSRRAARDVLRVTLRLLGLLARQAAEAVAKGKDPAPLLAASAAYDHSETARAGYYRALTRLAGNDELERLLPLLQTTLIRAQLRPLETRSNRAPMVVAIAAAAPDLAEAEAARHIEILLAALDTAPEAAFEPETDPLVFVP